MMLFRKRNKSFDEKKNTKHRKKVLGTRKHRMPLKVNKGKIQDSSTPDGTI
jgi:hypothetical protein